MLDYMRGDLIIINTLLLSISFGNEPCLVLLISFLTKYSFATSCLGILWKIHQLSYLISLQRLHLLFHGHNLLVTIIYLDRLPVTVRISASVTNARHDHLPSHTLLMAL